MPRKKKPTPAKATKAPKLSCPFPPPEVGDQFMYLGNRVEVMDPSPKQKGRGITRGVLKVSLLGTDGKPVGKTTTAMQYELVVPEKVGPVQAKRIVGLLDEMIKSPDAASLVGQGKKPYSVELLHSWRAVYGPQAVTQRVRVTTPESSPTPKKKPRLREHGESEDTPRKHKKLPPQAPEAPETPTKWATDAAIVAINFVRDVMGFPTKDARKKTAQAKFDGWVVDLAHKLDAEVTLPKVPLVDDGETDDRKKKSKKADPEEE